MHTPESPREWEDNPEAFTPEHLLKYMYSTFDRAFAADDSADDDSFEVSNGRFTHQGSLITNAGVYPNTWRVDMAPPHGAKRGYRARMYLALDPAINVLGGEPFDSRAGDLFVQERIGGRWSPIVRVDTIGATSAEVVEAIDVEKILAARRNDPKRRAEAIFRQLRNCNMLATID